MSRARVLGDVAGRGGATALAGRRDPRLRLAVVQTQPFSLKMFFSEGPRNRTSESLFHIAETAARNGGAKCAAMFSLSAPPLPLASASSALRTTLDERQGEHDTHTQPDPAIPVFMQYDYTISQNYTRGFLHVASSSLVLCLSRVVLGTGCEASATPVQENGCFAIDTLTRW